MRVTDLKTNRMVNPLGFDLGRPRLSYLVVDTAAKKQEAAQIQVALDVKFQETVYDSGKSADIDSLGFELPLELQPRTRYFWRVTVWAEGGETAASEPAWFETAKMDEPWAGKWIVPGYEDRIHPVLSRTFEVDKPVKSARAYACGVGLYEMYLNGRKCGGEYLAPGFNAYDHWLQYQTYDLTDVLNEGENTVEVLLGNGMYKGRFGFRDQGNVNVYGDQFALLCEIIIDFTDGTQLVVKSDQSWNARKSKILDSSIYDGEIYDATFEDPAV
nr:alfa-L-rhamnosidase RamA [Bacillota bacterium]